MKNEKINNKKMAKAKKIMATKGIMFCESIDFYANHPEAEKIIKETGNFLFWRVTEDGDVEYRNMHSFYGDLLIDDRGRYILSGEAPRNNDYAKVNVFNKN